MSCENCESAEAKRDALQQRLDKGLKLADDIEEEAKDADVIINNPSLYKQAVVRMIRAALGAPAAPPQEPQPTPVAGA